MARQSGVSTPIFDELLREMTEGVRPPEQPEPPPSPPPAPGAAAPDNAPRRRHRAD